MNPVILQRLHQQRIAQHYGEFLGLSVEIK
jgi:hypothetical protein